MARPIGNTHFSIAVHLMAALGVEWGGELTSSELAASINTSPSFVRRILSKLSKAGLVKATPGKAGACVLGREMGTISLLDIYKAVGHSQIFAIHGYPIQKSCRVSCHIRSSMEKVLEKMQKILEKDLDHTSLLKIVSEIRSQ